MSISSLATPMDAQLLALTQAPAAFDLNNKKPLSMDKVEATAQDFEAQFLSQLLSSMFSTVDLKAGLGGSESEETYQSLMINEYGKTIARAGGIGVADQIKRTMLKMQEVTS